MLSSREPAFQSPQSVAIIILVLGMLSLPIMLGFWLIGGWLNPELGESMLPWCITLGIIVGLICTVSVFRMAYRHG